MLTGTTTGRGPRAGETDNGDDDDDDDGTSVTAGFGVLFGLNDDTSDVALKWSLKSNS